jgi:hypothetical protein
MYGVGGVKVALAVLVVALAAVMSASAAGPVRLAFDQAEAAPHTLVHGKTAGKGALLRFRKRALSVYLRSDRNVRLGRLTVSRKGNGTMRFIVPNVPPGQYDALLRGLPGTPALRVVGSFRVVEGAARRTCEQSVYGRLGDDWLSRARTVGPAHMVGFGSDAPSRDSTTGEFAVKVLLVIDRGPPVTISVAPEDRTLVALMYISTRFNIHRVTDQDAAVTFEPCAGDATTQFNGGFVLRRPLCAHLTLTVEGREPIPFALPLGQPCASS